MNRTRTALWYGVAAVGLAALWAWKTGYFFPEPSLDPNPLAYRRGEAVVKARCLNCHETIPLAPRVAGWTPEYAYDALGHLPQLQPAMPPFAGTEQERADVAVYLSLLGKTVSPEEAAAVVQPDWQPPQWPDPEAEPPRRGPE